MRLATLTAPAICAVWLCFSAIRPDDIPFTRHTIDLGVSETCAIADVNHDGKPDIISGENWFEGPAWKAHRFRRLSFSNQYLDNFTDLALDVNNDGYPDVISGSYFSRRLVWLENPRRP